VARLRDAEAADHLHRNLRADGLEHRQCGIGQMARCRQCGIGPARVELQVQPHSVDARIDHLPRHLDGTAGRSLMRQEDVGEGEARHVRGPPTVVVPHRADAASARNAGEGEKVDDVAAPLVDAGRLVGSAIHALHVGEQQSIRKALPEDRHDIAHTLGLEQRRAQLDQRDPGREPGLGHDQPLRHIVGIDRDLEAEAALQQLENARRGARHGCGRRCHR